MGIYLGRAYFNDLREISFLYGVLLLGALIHLEFHSGGPGGGGGGGGRKEESYRLYTPFLTFLTHKKDNHANQFHSITVISNLLVRGEQFQLFENPNNVYM